MGQVGWVLLVACGSEKSVGTGTLPGLGDTAGKDAACSPLEWTLWQELLPPDLPRGDLEAAEHGTAPGDLDGDGDLDILLAWEGGSTVLLNDGRGRLTREDRWTVDGAPLPPASSAALADLDGDGDLDGWLGRSHGGVDLILMQNAPGQFTAIALPGTETGSWSGAFVDLDGDLDLDLVIGSRPKVLEPTEFRTGEVRGEPNPLVFQDADGWRVTDGPNPPDEVDGLGTRVTVRSGAHEQTPWLLPGRLHGQGCPRPPLWPGRRRGGGAGAGLLSRWEHRGAERCACGDAHATLAPLRDQSGGRSW